MPPRKRPASAISSSQSSIGSFARITKPYAVSSTLKTPSDLENSSSHNGNLRSEIISPTLKSRKRKLETSPTTPPNADLNDDVRNSKRRKVRSSDHYTLSNQSTVQLASKKTTIATLPTPESTPVSKRFCQLLQNEPSTPSESLHRGKISYNTPPLTPQSTPSKSSPIEAVNFPEELQSLIDLHGAFLRALTLHYAHHGPSSPIDVRLILPSISKIWGERAVTLEDIRRSIGVFREVSSDNSGSAKVFGPLLRLSDYGKGKICIERQDLKVGHIDEIEWNSPFLKRLERIWQDRNYLNNSLENTGGSFTEIVAQMPLARIEKCSALEKVKPMFAEGQRRLEDLKNGAIKAQSKPFHGTSAIAKASTGVRNRSEELLKRLKAKELKQSTIKLESPANIARKAALQRMDEIVSVLSRASPTNISTDYNLQCPRRHTHSLPMLIDNIKHSIRRPISKDETERCLRLLADEIAEQFVTFVNIGRVTCVVIDPAKKPIDLNERITVALKVNV